MPSTNYSNTTNKKEYTAITGLKAPKDYSKYTLMRGVTDFSNLAQYDLYESGYSFLVVVSAPKFMTKLAELKAEEFGVLWKNYLHILEYEFRGLDGLEDMSSDNSTLTNGINDLNLITKTNLQSASTFSMRFFEKSGSVITRVHETFLRGIKDPRTQFKHYHGLIEDPNVQMVPGFENEVFSFLYFVTDNTGTQVEKAYYIVSSQPTGAPLSIYESEKGTIEFKEITVEFSGFPITGKEIDKRAKMVLDWINGKTVDGKTNANPIVKNSNDATSTMYKAIDNIEVGNMALNKV